MSENQLECMVSIRCMTYNHASYIEDAMNGFCMQQTTFPFVAVIVDDASTDGEPEVIKNYLHNHFDMQKARTWETDDAHFIEAIHKESSHCIFAVVLLKHNLYLQREKKNSIIEKWQNSKYIALCEGDDYWINPHKLQKQVDYLESNTSYSMCFHSVHYDYSNEISNKVINESDCDVTIDDIIIEGGEFCPTCSLLLRKDLFFKKYKFRQMANVGDYPLQIICAMNGMVHYFSDIMGCYRVATVGSWTHRILSDKCLFFSYIKNEIDWMQELNRESEYRYQDAIFCKIAFTCSNCLNQGIVSRKEFFSYINKVNCKHLNDKYKKLFFEFKLKYKHPRVYRLRNNRDLASFVYLLSPFIYNKYISWRVNSLNNMG